MSLSPFWADVLRPAFHALAPEDPAVVARRVRNAAGTTAVLSALLPPVGTLGTGTVTDANVLTGAYAVVTVFAHLRRDADGGDLHAALALTAAGLAPWWTSGGVAWWGLWLGVAALFHLGTSRLRRTRGPLPDPPVEHDPLPRRTGGLVVRVGGLAYVLATALVFWTVVTQHMKVPTGSMQPTIMGDHGIGNRYGGDRLLADHMVYSLREPRRFEIVVFRYPLRRDILFVKRLIGMPGEHVEIREGDIWVDGKVVRKPTLVQETLWQEIFPERATARSAKPKDVANAWRASEDHGWRKAGSDGLRVVPDDDPRGLAAFRDRLTVDDLRVGFLARPAGASSVAVLRITSSGRVVSMEVPAGEAGGALWVEDGPRVELAASIVGGARVELSVCDGLARAVVDGKEAGRLELPPRSGTRIRAEIGARGGELELADLRLEEDIDYVANGGLSEFHVPEGCYVMLGDNTRQSEDSRMWAAKEIYVEGREEPYLVEQSSTDMAGGLVRNLVREGGRVRFVDADGLPRDLPAAAIVRDEPPTRHPFVRREDLVGRAAIVFWPVPPFGSSFRPRILP